FSPLSLHDALPIYFPPHRRLAFDDPRDRIGKPSEAAAMSYQRDALQLRWSHRYDGNIPDQLLSHCELLSPQARHFPGEARDREPAWYGRLPDVRTPRYSKGPRGNRASLDSDFARAPGK